MFTGIKIVFEPKTFGEFVRVARAARGMSQKELSERSGVKRTTLVMLENHGKDTKGSTMTALVKALGFQIQFVDLKAQAGDEQK